MCSSYTGENIDGPIFKELIILMRDWEWDEKPQELDEMVNVMSKVLLKVVGTKLWERSITWQFLLLYKIKNRLAVAVITMKKVFLLHSLVYFSKFL